MSIFDFTPDGYEDPKCNKKIILEDIQKEIKKGTKYIVLEAPTGIGKSWIAATVALWRKDSCILTPNKILQDQYEKNFPNFMTVVKGKSSFACLQLENVKTCEYGHCTSPEGNCKHLPNKKDFQIVKDTLGTKNEKITLLNDSEEVCEYWKQRFIGDMSSFSVYNYDMFVSTQMQNEQNKSPRFRDVLICDEAEQLEDKLSGILTVELSADDLNLLPHSDLKPSFDKIDEKTSLYFVTLLIEQLISELENELNLQNPHMECSRYLGSLQHIRQHPELVCKKHRKRRHKKCTGNCKKSFTFVKNLSCYNCKDHLPLNNDGDVCSNDHSRFNQIKQKRIESKIKNFKNKLVQLGCNEGDYFSRIEHDSQNNKTIYLDSIDVSKIAQKIFKQFNHVIFISSTINEESFLKNLGIVKTSEPSIPEYFIPHERYRALGREILFESATSDEIAKVLELPDYFYKFDSKGKEFFACLDDFIPKSSKVIRNENGKIEFRDDHEMTKSIKIMNSKNSSFYRDYDNPIPKENRKIIPEYLGHIVEHTKKDLMPKIISKIEDLLDKNSEKKGIIHVTSYEWQKDIIEKISKRHASRLECVIKDEGYYDKKSVQNIQKFSSIDALLDSHENSKYSVILSPSCWYGVDLVGKRSEFQIIVKVPFRPLTSGVKKKRKLDKDWYETTAAYKSIQGCGRSVRNERDCAVTYLLDTNFKTLFKNRHVRPWFLDSLTSN